MSETMVVDPLSSLIVYDHAPLVALLRTVLDRLASQEASGAALAQRVDGAESDRKQLQTNVDELLQQQSAANERIAALEGQPHSQPEASPVFNATNDASEDTGASTNASTYASANASAGDNDERIRALTDRISALESELRQVKQATSTNADTSVNTSADTSAQPLSQPTPVPVPTPATSSTADPSSDDSKAVLQNLMDRTQTLESDTRTSFLAHNDRLQQLETEARALQSQLAEVQGKLEALSSTGPTSAAPSPSSSRPQTAVSHAQSSPPQPQSQTHSRTGSIAQPAPNAVSRRSSTNKPVPDTVTATNINGDSGRLDSLSSSVAELQSLYQSLAPKYSELNQSLTQYQTMAQKQLSDTANKLQQEKNDRGTDVRQLNDRIDRLSVGGGGGGGGGSGSGTQSKDASPRGSQSTASDTGPLLFARQPSSAAATSSRNGANDSESNTGTSAFNDHDSGNGHDWRALNEKYQSLGADHSMLVDQVQQQKRAQDTLISEIEQLNFQLKSMRQLPSLRASPTAENGAAAVAQTAPVTVMATASNELLVAQIDSLQNQVNHLEAKYQQLRAQPAPALRPSAHVLPQSPSHSVPSTSLSLLSQALVNPPSPSLDTTTYTHIHYSLKQLRSDVTDLASKQLLLANSVAKLQQAETTKGESQQVVLDSIAKMDTTNANKLQQLAQTQKTALDFTRTFLANEILSTERKLADNVNSRVNALDRELKHFVIERIEPLKLNSETSGARLSSVKCITCGMGAQTIVGPASSSWVQQHGQSSTPSYNEMRIAKGNELFIGGRDGQLYRGRTESEVTMVKGDQSKNAGFNVLYVDHAAAPTLTNNANKLPLLSDRSGSTNRDRGHVSGGEEKEMVLAETIVSAGQSFVTER